MVVRGEVKSELAIKLFINPTMQIEAPCKLEAAIITMIANKAIRIGLHGQENQSRTLQLDITEMLVIPTKLLQIGEFSMQSFPKNLICGVRTLVLEGKGPSQISEYFESKVSEDIPVIKLWQP